MALRDFGTDKPPFQKEGVIALNFDDVFPHSRRKVGVIHNLLIDDGGFQCQCHCHSYFGTSTERIPSSVSGEFSCISVCT